MRASRTMALVRIAVAIMFLFFAEYKLVGWEFGHGGYAKYVGDYIEHTAVSFWKPFLRLTLTHPVISGYAVAVTELLIGLSMLLGYKVRIFSVVGALFMLNLLLCTWNAPGPGMWWRYLGNEIDNLGMFFLFLLFFEHDAGKVWGMDARGPRRVAAKAA
jgi:uncharacterized membrane protein YphA (DoxX/SURF4 family)